MMTRINFGLHTSDGWQLPETAVKCAGYNFLCAKRHFEQAFAKEPEIFQNGSWVAIPNENVKGKEWHFVIGCIELLPLIGHVVALVERFFGKNGSLPAMSPMFPEQTNETISKESTANLSNPQPSTQSSNTTTEESQSLISSFTGFVGSAVSSIFGSKPAGPDYPDWLSEKIQDAPQVRISTLLDLEKELESHNTVLATLSSGGFGFKLNVEHIPVDSTYQRTLSTKSIVVAVLSPGKENAWTTYQTSSDLTVEVPTTDEDKEAWNETSKLFPGLKDEPINPIKTIYFNATNFSCNNFFIPEEKTEIYSNTEKQNEFKEPRDTSNLAWFLYRIFSGKSVMVVERRDYELLPNMDNPIGYWKFSLAKVES
ncbi:MAG TPA: hypothetical protein VIH61_08940 [Waddliaceae bacterium]